MATEPDRDVPPELELELERQCAYQPPDSKEVGERHGQVRAATLLFMRELVYLCPASNERTEALKQARLAMFWGNAAIACNQARQDDER